MKRFWSKVKITSLHGCWEWQASNTGRYGVFWLNRRQDLARRVAYELVRGPIAEGLCIDHLCRNTLCVNPFHLEVVTALENQRRGAGSGGVLSEVRSECLRGHPRTTDNLDTIGACKQCRRDRKATPEYNRYHKQYMREYNRRKK